MDLATVPASVLETQLNTLFLAVNGRLASIQNATRNPAIRDPRMLRIFKKDIATLYTNISALNKFVNPEMTPAPVAAAAPSPFFIHRGEEAAYTTPAKAPVASSGTPTYSPVAYSQGSSKAQSTNIHSRRTLNGSATGAQPPKNRNKTVKSLKKLQKKNKK